MKKEKHLCMSEVMIRTRFMKEVKSLNLWPDKHMNLDKENEHFKWSRKGNLPEKGSLSGHWQDFEVTEPTLHQEYMFFELYFQ